MATRLQSSSFSWGSWPVNAQDRGRLGEGFGLLIDRATPVEFSVDGRIVHGFEGDVIASALAASGTWVLSRSSRYQRPRGVLTMAGQDRNTLMSLPDEPAVLADRHPISSGLDVRSCGHEEGLQWDGHRLLGRLRRFMPAGAVYRSLLEPSRALRPQDRTVRRTDGLSRVNADAVPGYYDQGYGFHDVVVVGGGPSGMQAALEAANAGADVLLLDEWPQLGGALCYARFGRSGRKPKRLRRQLIDEIEAHQHITVMRSAVCTGVFSGGWLSVIKGHRLHKIRAGQMILATGSIEQPMVFRNNDLPGVMLSSAAQRLMRLYAVAPGRRGVIATANDHGYELALDLLDAGIKVEALVDLRPERAPNALSDAMIEKGVRVERGHTLVEAIGKEHVEGVRLARIERPGERGEPGAKIACDFVCTAIGYHPADSLVRQADAANGDSDGLILQKVNALPDNMTAVGSANGVDQLDVALDDGRRAGGRAAKTVTGGVFAEGVGEGDATDPVQDPQSADNPLPLPIVTHPRGGEFVDLVNDVQINDVEHAVDADLMDQTSGNSHGGVKTRPLNPPILAEKIAHLAGRGVEPVRLTAIHHRHVEAGAQMKPQGLWLYPAFYGPKEQAERLIAREVVHCREKVGLIDISMLGGLDIRGPDAAAFIGRLYNGRDQHPAVGRARHLMIADEAGMIMDEGLICRLHAEHHYLTTTTSGADALCQQLLHRKEDWQLDVDITNVSAAYAGVTIVGPNSRKVVATLASDIDFSAHALPFMGVRLGQIAGMPVRVLRSGFVGDQSYEIHCPSSMGEALWDSLIKAGEPFAIKPIGEEARQVMRLEKGHVAIGQDIAVPAPALWPSSSEVITDRTMTETRPIFVSKQRAEIRTLQGGQRHLVGFTLARDGDPCPKVGQLVIREDAIIGRVTSAVYSPTLRKVIGLALVPVNQAEPGQRFPIKIEGGRLIEAVVVPTPFHDPKAMHHEPLEISPLVDGEEDA